MPHDSCDVPECKEGHNFAYQGLKPQNSASSHQLDLHLIENLIYFDFVFALCYVVKMLLSCMSAAVLKLLVHSYSTVWLLAAELSMVVSGAGRMRTTRRSWATREATTEPAKASNHNALHMHDSRYRKEKKRLRVHLSA